MWKTKKEIKKTYIDHIDSVRMSGLGTENYRSEILGHMLETLKEFDEGLDFPDFRYLT